MKTDSKLSTISDLIKLANHLDSIGFATGADKADQIIVALAQENNPDLTGLLQGALRGGINGSNNQNILASLAQQVLNNPDVLASIISPEQIQGILAALPPETLNQLTRTFADQLARSAFEQLEQHPELVSDVTQQVAETALSNHQIQGLIQGALTEATTEIAEQLPEKIIQQVMNIPKAKLNEFIRRFGSLKVRMGLKFLFKNINKTLKNLRRANMAPEQIMQNLNPSQLTGLLESNLQSMPADNTTPQEGADLNRRQRRRMEREQRYRRGYR